MKALEKERISPYISQLYECGINDSDIKLVVDQFRTDLSGSSSLFLLRDDDKSDGIKLFLITHDPQPASRADMASEGLPRLHAPIQPTCS